MLLLLAHLNPGLLQEVCPVVSIPVQDHPHNGGYHSKLWLVLTEGQEMRVVLSSMVMVVVNSKHILEPLANRVLVS